MIRVPERRELDLEAARSVLAELVRPLLGWLLVGAGITAITVGWFGVSREALVARQLPYLVSGGLAGLALVVVGAVLLGGHDLRRYAARVDRLEQKLTDLHGVLLDEIGETAAEAQGSEAARREVTGDARVLVLPEGERFHRPGCPIVANKDGLERVPRDEARDRGLLPCKLCAGEVEETA